MAKFELIMPKMGESIMEATILNWVKKVGDKISMDETILEIATDKVDSEIPSPVDGVLSEILYKENDVVEIGKVIAYIATEGEDEAPKASKEKKSKKPKKEEVQEPVQVEALEKPLVQKETVQLPSVQNGGRFYSPLVKNMAKTEGIGLEELSAIPGSGSKGRVTKKDMLQYIENRGKAPVSSSSNGHSVAKSISAPATPTTHFASGTDEIVQMDRMRKLIADHMVMSKHTSPHVTSFIEADVTDIVNWRNKNKKKFQEKFGEKITFTPIFMEAVVKAIKDFPLINVSVNDDQIIIKKDINIGMAAALPSGNLIVPVIKNADHLNLIGLTKSVNDLANRARANKLKPEEIQGGTFTLTNVGTFGNVMGTPIINQPQVAILAVGAIRKKPAVKETEYGDVIVIRQMMFLSLSYDHRVVDGFLGGSFLRRIGDYLEAFDASQEI